MWPRGRGGGGGYFVKKLSSGTRGNLLEYLQNYFTRALLSDVPYLASKHFKHILISNNI